jgi:hypothetical protein
MSILADEFAAFYVPGDVDETWNCKASDSEKEIANVEKRGNDIFPQGRDNCKKFLKECGKKGFDFKVCAKKTSPHWTWYFEVNSPCVLLMFIRKQTGDEKWKCSGSDADKEIANIDKRGNDIYPQGRHNCKAFLKVCKERGFKFRVRAKKTSPYWTWYFEAITPILSVNLSDFYKDHDGDETWKCKCSDADKEIGLIDQRKNDLYPQGRANCQQFLRECKERGYKFKVKAKKTKPYWTWYYEVTN